MTGKWFRLTASAVLGSALALAQSVPATGTNGNTAVQGHRHNWRAHRFQRMASALNLTDAQKEQAKSLFKSAREEAKPVVEQLKQNRQAMAAAVKAGNDAQIQQLANQQGALMGQMIGIRTKAMAKMYASLTPDQQQKADQLRQQFQARFHTHMRRHTSSKTQG